MSVSGSYSKFAHKRIVKLAWIAGAALLAIALAIPSSAADNKKKGTVAPPAHNVPKADDKVSFDITKIVWPNPPAIARIRWSKQLTGEKIDTSAVKKVAKKEKWMDRLAGTKSQAEK